MAAHNNGMRRPNRSVIHANRRFPMNPPKHINDATMDDCSTVILPVGSGESPDVSNSKLGDAQPHVTPKFSVKILAISNRVKGKRNLRNLLISGFYIEKRNTKNCGEILIFCTWSWNNFLHFD